jgi:formylglycine-generating enzyme required for sulfatase activity/serine/threonine protein kinase
MNERDIFLAAIEIADPARRASYVEQSCGTDARLRVQVEELLKTHAQSSQFLETPAVAPNSSVAQTLVTETSHADEDSHAELTSAEAEFRKYLQPATRTGWLGRLGHYEIEAILGRGAFGIVAKAFDEKLHRVVAIKLMNPELAATSPPRKRFLREARTAAAVTHENIVAIHAVEEEPIPYLVMEYIPGQTLQQRMDTQGPLDLAEILRVGQQVAAGLAAAHAANLIHRDIKPSNILLTDGPTQRAKISDFGLARAVDDASMTSSGMIAGTPLYMAPEQARGDVLDHRADLFSLGSVLYQMASGRPPFRAANTVAVLKRVCEDTPRPLDDVIPGIPGWLDAIIFRLLEKDRDVRYQTARELSDLLARCQWELEHNGQVTCVKGSPRVEETQVFPSARSTGRGVKPKPIGLLVGGVLAVAAVMGLALMNGGSKTPEPDTTSQTAATTSPSSTEATAVKSPEAIGWHGWPTDAPKPAIAPFDAAQAQRHQEEWAAYLKVPVEYTNSIGMKFRLIPPGEFTMGSTEAEIEAALKDVDPKYMKHWGECLQSEAPQHKVVLTQPIYLGVNEVTQAEYEKVMAANPSWFASMGNSKEAVAGLETAEHPVENVSWNEAAEYCAKLSQQEKLKPFYFRAGETITPMDGTGYRLPSEAEWEFACRAGTTTKYWIGDQDADLVRAGWFGMNSGGRTHAAGELKANPFGLSDMHGNVWEWVQDGFDATFYGQFEDKPAIDPISPFPAASLRVTRGGMWYYVASGCRSSDRNAHNPTYRYGHLGFRVSLTIDAVRQALKTPGVTEARSSWHGWPTDAPKPAIAPFDAAQAQRHQEEWAAYLKLPVEYTNSIGMKFRLIPPGEFMMGSTETEIEAALKDDDQDKNWHEGIKSEAPQHKVILTQPVYLGVNEVTQAEYEKVMGSNPSHFAPLGMGKEAVAGLETAEHPVDTVSWNDAAEFCAKLSKQEKLKPFYFRAAETITPLDGNGYRLPSEAEWEFACRAGTATKYWIGGQDADLIRAGWFDGNSGGRTHAVGELKANPFGLSDMHGNVWEWVQDGWDANSYAQFQVSPAINPGGPFAGSHRVLRGGSWASSVSFCRTSHRHAPHAPSFYFYGIGVRVSLTIDAVRQALKTPGVAEARSSWHGWPADAPAPAIAPFDAAQAKQHQEAWAAYLKVPVEYTNSLGMKFRLIPPGEFTMGSTPAEIEAALPVRSGDQFSAEQATNWKAAILSEGPQQPTVMTKPFYLAVHEVTQAAYEELIGQNPSHFSASGPGKDMVAGLLTGQHPVESLNWMECVEFCSRLSQREQFKPHYFRAGDTVAPMSGAGYRLPTEAEWEFASRGGSTTQRWVGDGDEAAMEVAWFVTNSGGRTHAVGELLPNPFGLYDILGNVCEYCEDGVNSTKEQPYSTEQAVNPRITWVGRDFRRVRGGEYKWEAACCRSAFRNQFYPTERYSEIGFRIALEVDAVRQALKTPGVAEAQSSWHGWPADSPKPAIAPFDAAQAKQHQEAWAAYLKLPVEYTNSIGMKFRLIPPGEFTMGSTEAEIEGAIKDAADHPHWHEYIQSEGPQHKVILTQAIYLCVHEVTQKEYAVVIGTNPSFFASTGEGQEFVANLDTQNHPVETVSWHDAAEFCAKLSQQEELKPFYFRAGETITPLDGTGYRLPTEAEWEFACRAGTTTKYWIGDQEDQLVRAGWIATNSGARTHAVGELKSNPLGLFDMHGNSWEWVEDTWEPRSYLNFAEVPSIDPRSVNWLASSRMIRGGDWDVPGVFCRASYRVHDVATRCDQYIGFRVSLPAETVRQLWKVTGPDMPRNVNRETSKRPTPNEDPIEFRR